MDVTPTSAMFFNKQYGKLTRAGITYILQKYVSMAEAEIPDMFRHLISPHTLRHSKAMHLLEGGVNLTYIRDFFGHASARKSMQRQTLRSNEKLLKMLVLKRTFHKMNASILTLRSSGTSSYLPTKSMTPWIAPLLSCSGYRI